MSNSQEVGKAGVATVRRVTVRQVAAEWQLHPETIRAAIRSGALPAGWVGNGYRLLAADVEAWVKRTWGG